MSQENVTEQDVIEVAQKEAVRRGCQVHRVVEVEDQTPPPREFHGQNGQVVFADNFGKWLVILYVTDRTGQETEVFITVQQTGHGLYALPR